MDTTSVFAEIIKTAPQADGSLLVYGKATGSDIDLDHQRCDPEWLKKAMPEWFGGPFGGNLREQHDPQRAVGKATEHEVKPDGHWITAKVVDPIAKAKVEAGVLSGFSIGIREPRLEKSNGQEWIKDGKIIEVSLVDRPCLPTAVFTMCKSAKPGMSLKACDFDSQRMLVRVEELVEKTTDVASEIPEMRITLAEGLSPEAAEKLKKIANEEKAVEPDIRKDDDADMAVTPDSTHGCGCCSQCGMSGSADSSSTGKSADFDRDAAKTLVAEAIEKADSGLGQDESGDISGALQAISIIAELIQSEAKDLGDTPAQGCDIDLLMQAVHALRIFNCREAKEQAGIDPGPGPIMLAADADVTKDSKEPYGDVTYADPGYQSDKKKRYPLDSKAHAKSAWDFINQASNADKYSADQVKSIKSRIMAACKKFGVEIDADSKKAVDMADTITNVDEAQKAADEALEKAVAATEEVAIEAVEKTDSPETTKAAVVEVTEFDDNALVKAVSAALEKIFSTDELEKADNPIRKTLGDIVSAANESIVKSVNALSERLETVEQMATPGGPALRRTDSEHKVARASDLTQRLNQYKTLAENLKDPDARKGYAKMAAVVEDEINAL